MNRTQFNPIQSSPVRVEEVSREKKGEKANGMYMLHQAKAPINRSRLPFPLPLHKMNEIRIQSKHNGQEFRDVVMYKVWNAKRWPGGKIKAKIKTQP
ncbi:predicted protein [Plenodomus lingam JN3]|uniref:Predicted protein n=1 Tax=Leptosphaeria maculans (strain JN3 / isolate v23.1.3 / race Av1-4-5-6-7-8) TaxID=985895 RepID=E4ZZL9_LEPMJ|nr:predicted protein [Plenodomus lingam JN3]CBX97135.1 predicted protein [Plenodomus lingam JN3]